jgi:hypothetical protein
MVDEYGHTTLFRHEHSTAFSVHTTLWYGFNLVVPWKKYKTQSAELFGTSFKEIGLTIITTLQV